MFMRHRLFVCWSGCSRKSPQQTQTLQTNRGLQVEPWKNLSFLSLFLFFLLLFALSEQIIGDIWGEERKIIDDPSLYKIGQ